MRVEFAGPVEGDLDVIAEYISRDNPGRATTFLQEIRTEMQAIGRNPLLYRLRPEIGAEARLAVVGRYVILFRVARNAVRIERIVHGRRDLRALFSSDE